MNAKRKTQAEQRSERVYRVGPEPSVCLRQYHLRLTFGSISGAIELIHNNHYVSSMANRPSLHGSGANPTVCATIADALTLSRAI
jgi:hypothetical protein